MKKLVLSICLLLFSLSAFSQEIQLHFDPRHALYSDGPERNYFTATFQMFRPDKWGSTFGFIDMDFNQSKGNVGLAYLEIYRNIKIGKSPIMAHVEYNGGILKDKKNNGFSIPNAYLAGAAYSHAIGKIYLDTYLAYKYNAFDKVSHDIQWTGIWNANFCDDKITLTGFVDIWTANKNQSTGKGGKKVIFLTEPQIWYNIDKHIAFGSEIEISNNFLPYSKKTYVLPTIAGKWTF